MRRTQSFFLVVAMAATFVVLTAAVAPAVGISASCRGSIARVENLLGQTIEPFVANAQNVPCVSARSGLIPETTVGPLTFIVAATQTFDDAATKNARAQAAVLGLAIGAPAPPIAALAVFSTANAFCGVPSSFVGSSVVVGLSIAGNEVVVPPGHSHITIPGVATLHLNHVEHAANSVTARSIWLDLAPRALPDVIVAESHADC